MISFQIQFSNKWDMRKITFVFMTESLDPNFLQKWTEQSSDQLQIL